MNIADLKPKQGNADITAEVVEVSEPREFSKFGKPGRVSTATIKDATGVVKLTLWNEQIDQVSAGDKVTIKNGWVGEWQGELQLTTGKMGSLEIVGKGSSALAKGAGKSAAPAAKPSAKAAHKKEKGDLTVYDLDADEE